jgi:hypothetical protein
MESHTQQIFKNVENVDTKSENDENGFLYIIRSVCVKKSFLNGNIERHI